MTPGIGAGGEQEVRIRDTDGQEQGNEHTHTVGYSHGLNTCKGKHIYKGKFISIMEKLTT